MTAVISLPTATFRREDNEGLLAILAELHVLVSIDPILGASAARTYFVVSPDPKQRVAKHLASTDAACATEVYAIVAYNFPFALHQFQATDRRISQDRAKAITSCSAELQEDALVAAAAALGLEAVGVSDFDAEALTAQMFPGSQESIVAVVRLSRARA